MRLENTARGCRSAITSESGSFIAGRSPMKYGLHIVDRLAGVRYRGHMKTVLITGCSAGYGLETARYFHAQGWNVIATMRTPRQDVLARSARVRVLALDVTRPESIAAGIEAAGPIDVLVNNAGIGVVGVFEATPM